MCRSVYAWYLNSLAFALAHLQDTNQKHAWEHLYARVFVQESQREKFVYKESIQEDIIIEREWGCGP
jgi:hypothetical protein